MNTYPDEKTIFINLSKGKATYNSPVDVEKVNRFTASLPADILVKFKEIEQEMLDELWIALSSSKTTLAYLRDIHGAPAGLTFVSEKALKEKHCGINYGILPTGELVPCGITLGR
jgi:hypothetical protein